MQAQHPPCVGMSGVATAAYCELGSLPPCSCSSLPRKLQGAAVGEFLARLDACAAGEAAFTLVLDDPAGNSYVEAGAGADAALALERYERTPEQARVRRCTGMQAGGGLVFRGQKLCCGCLAVLHDMADSDCWLHCSVWLTSAA